MTKANLKKELAYLNKQVNQSKTGMDGLLKRRRQLFADMVEAGFTQDEIAKLCGFSGSAVVSRALKAVRLSEKEVG